ncbi:CinA-like protein [Pantoea agglomerans]|uniref:CinA-like protein n=1 Tax=Enterobacter agglomerans TaxID=549 RepID=A0A379AEY6_ENTAG|nr:CinA-like protein [Pantoea agglomerans]
MIRVEMLSTGDEVLHGQIVDTNAAWLADMLFQQGLPMTSRTTVGDSLESLIATLQARSHEADVLIVNGGLGPTSDDLSALAAARACGVELEVQQGVAGTDGSLVRQPGTRDGGQQSQAGGNPGQCGTD